MDFVLVLQGEGACGAGGPVLLPPGRDGVGRDRGIKKCCKAVTNF